VDRCGESVALGDPRGLDCFVGSSLADCCSGIDYDALELNQSQTSVSSVLRGARSLGREG
jgi:hypothetical protein